MLKRSRVLLIIGLAFGIWIIVLLYSLSDAKSGSSPAYNPEIEKLKRQLQQKEDENTDLMMAAKSLLEDRNRLEEAFGNKGCPAVAAPVVLPTAKAAQKPAIPAATSTITTVIADTRPGIVKMGDHDPRSGPRHRVLARMPVVTEDLVRRAKPQTVLVWGSHFFGDITGETKCPIKCMFTADTGTLDKADAVWFHIPTFSSFPGSKRPGQKWVAMSMEGDGYYPKLKDADFMSQFDLTMTYRLDTDVPTPYASWSEYNFMEAPINKTDEALAVFVASNCGPKNRRNEWVEELMKLIPVHSYGRCFNNREFPTSGSNNWFQKKIDVLRPYKFYLAFDNTDSVDYVSEKFFHGLVAGTVPVYMGAPNIEDFEPSPHSVIKVDDFKTPKELADFLLLVGSNEGLYQSYLQWKRDGVSQKFRDLVNLNDIHSRCRLCIRLAQDQLGLDNESNPRK